MENVEFIRYAISTSYYHTIRVRENKSAKYINSYNVV